MHTSEIPWQGKSAFCIMAAGARLAGLILKTYMGHPPQELLTFIICVPFQHWEQGIRSTP